MNDLGFDRRRYDDAFGAFIGRHGGDIVRQRVACCRRTLVDVAHEQNRLCREQQQLAERGLQVRWNIEGARRREFLTGLGLSETGLARVIRSGYRLLDLITFLTANPKEARAWTVPNGTLAPEAAGQIHTDFQKGFIRAETISYNDYIACGGEQQARDAGKLRQEGKQYVVRDGDVILFRFNV